MSPHGILLFHIRGHNFSNRSLYSIFNRSGAAIEESHKSYHYFISKNVVSNSGYILPKEIGIPDLLAKKCLLFAIA